MNTKESVPFSVFLRAPGPYQLSGKSFIWEANRSTVAAYRGVSKESVISLKRSAVQADSLFSPNLLLLARSQGKCKKNIE